MEHGYKAGCCSVTMHDRESASCAGKRRNEVEDVQMSNNPDIPAAPLGTGPVQQTAQDLSFKDLVAGKVAPEAEEHCAQAFRPRLCVNLSQAKWCRRAACRMGSRKRPQATAAAATAASRLLLQQERLTSALAEPHRQARPACRKPLRCGQLGMHHPKGQDGVQCMLCSVSNCKGRSCSRLMCDGAGPANCRGSGSGRSDSGWTERCRSASQEDWERQQHTGLACRSLRRAQP